MGWLAGYMVYMCWQAGWGAVGYFVSLRGSVLKTKGQKADMKVTYPIRLSM